MLRYITTESGGILMLSDHGEIKIIEKWPQFSIGASQFTDEGSISVMEEPDE